MEGAEREDFQVHLDSPPIPRTTVFLSASVLARLKHGLQRAGFNVATFVWLPASDPRRRSYPRLRTLDIDDVALVRHA